MSNLEDYNMKLEVIKAIPDDQIKPPNSIHVGKGYDLRNQIAHHFYYAFHDSPSLIAKVNTFLEGNIHAHMIQCLNNFSVLGRANQELLTSIGFDLTLLDQAAQKCDELASMYAAASRDRQDFSAVKKIRDQSFTHVKEAVDKIRKCGQYVFWRNAGRVKGYRSNYLRRIRLRNTRRKTLPVRGLESENPDLDQ
jgi:hypothetical protein